MKYIFLIAFSCLLFVQAVFSQSTGKSYLECNHDSLITVLRAYEDSLASASSATVVRVDYAWRVTDAAVAGKVYKIYRCEALYDSLTVLIDAVEFARATAPVVDTDSVSAITATGATFHAKVTSDGGLPVLHQWFRFGTTSTNLTDSVDASALTTTPFTRAVNTLGSGTYYVAAFAKNAKGTASGDTLTFNMFTCGTSTVSYDGHNYTTVLLGTQCWFKENLRTTTYRDTSVITANLSNTAWKDYTSGAQTIYGSDGGPYHGSADTTANRNTYGRLYNWYAVSDSRGLCPTGWHVPSATEWTTLMSNYPTDPATALKDSLPPWDGLNTSGFTARPGGWRWGGDGTYSYSTIRGYFWLSTEISPTEGAVRSMMNGSTLVTDEQYAKDTGFSVRCLKD